MKPSVKLQSQMDRLSNIGAYALSRTEKLELQSILDELQLRPLTNLECGTCVRTALWDLIDYYKRKDETPRLQMKMVKNLEDMKYNELKKLAKDKGLKAGRINKSELINLLKNK